MSKELKDPEVFIKGITGHSGEQIILKSLLHDQPKDFEFLIKNEAYLNGEMRKYLDQKTITERKEYFEELKRSVTARKNLIEKANEILNKGQKLLKENLRAISPASKIALEEGCDKLTDSLGDRNSEAITTQMNLLSETIDVISDSLKGGDTGGNTNKSLLTAKEETARESEVTKTEEKALVVNTVSDPAFINNEFVILFLKFFHRLPGEDTNFYPVKVGITEHYKSVLSEFIDENEHDDDPATLFNEMQPVTIKIQYQNYANLKSGKKDRIDQSGIPKMTLGLANRCAKDQSEKTFTAFNEEGKPAKGQGEIFDSIIYKMAIEISKRNGYDRGVNEAKIHQHFPEVLLAAGDWIIEHGI